MKDKQRVGQNIQSLRARSADGGEGWSHFIERSDRDKTQLGRKRGRHGFEAFYGLRVPLYVWIAENGNPGKSGDCLLQQLQSLGPEFRGHE